MDVIYYNRISTDNKDQDITSNLESCKDFCEKNNHKIIKIFLDSGVSGDIPYFKRKNGYNMYKYIKTYMKKNNQLGIIVFSMDRFTRQNPVKALNIFESLKEQGVKIFSATENIFNEDSEFALPVQFNILWFNYYMLLQHSKKVKAGNQKRIQNGLHVGRALIKEIKGKGMNTKYIYYSKDELLDLHNRIKELIKKNSYREIVKLLKEENINISISYISKVINNNVVIS